MEIIKNLRPKIVLSWIVRFRHFYTNGSLKIEILRINWRALGASIAQSNALGSLPTDIYVSFPILFYA